MPFGTPFPVLLFASYKEYTFNEMLWQGGWAQTPCQLSVVCGFLTYTPRDIGAFTFSLSRLMISTTEWSGGRVRACMHDCCMW